MVPGEGAQLTVPVKEGDVIADRYRIERKLGSGGMGVVIAATHLLLEQAVAIKILHRKSDDSKDSVRRFLREARIVAQMKSPHVVRVFDVGTLPDGTPYMAMELLKGMDLDQHLEKSGAFSVSESVNYITQACEAVAEAHSLGVVHRDLKPANLFLTEGVDRLPLIKVLDFGIAKPIDRANPTKSSITRPLGIVGTPMYMSPEQLRGSSTVDKRTDIWSLGVILYELLSGRPPFVSESLTDLCAAVVRDPPETLENLPDGLWEVIVKCLEKKAEDRYGRLADLARALEPFMLDPSAVERITRVQKSVPPGSLDRPSFTEISFTESGSMPKLALLPDIPPSTPPSANDRRSTPSTTGPKAPFLSSTPPAQISVEPTPARRFRTLIGGVSAAALFVALGMFVMSALHNKAPERASGHSDPPAVSTTARPEWNAPSPVITAPQTGDDPPAAVSPATDPSTPKWSSSSPFINNARGSTKVSSAPPSASASARPVPSTTASSHNPDRFLDTR